jgi:hypothetical protein
MNHTKSKSVRQSPLKAARANGFVYPVWHLAHRLSSRWEEGKGYEDYSTDGNPMTKSFQDW